MGFLAFLLALAAVYLTPRLTAQEPVARVQAPVVDAEPAPPGPVRVKSATSSPARSRGPAPPPDAAALREQLDGIAADYPATYGVVVFDPSSKKTVAMNPDATFSAASIGKLPVLLALYKSAARGEVDLDEPITMLASNVHAYGTGVLYKRPVGHTITLRECAKLLVKESDNTAWKMLTRYMGRDYVQAELYNIGANSTEYWAPNITTPNDVLLVLRKISDPAYTSPKLSAEMLDLMTNTSFEDRLPKPLPEDARVAHKIGYYGDTFSDAGMVLPRGSHRDAYYIVVMATDTTEGTSRSATREISLAAYRFLAE